jgi:hypothetical protein
MTQKALKLALEALKAAQELAGKHDAEPEYGFQQVITAIKEALAQLATPPQPEQEPVKDWAASHNAICALLRQAHDALALTSYPMMHRWVGLTDDEMEATFIECGGKWNGDFWKIEDADFHPFLRTIEAKLKDKNS